MKIEDIHENDVLVSVDQNGAGYYRVLKVCKVMVRVRGENGNTFRAYPNDFNCKIDYEVRV